MNSVSFDPIGAGLPMAIAIAYLPRLFKVLDALTTALLAGSLLISATLSYCDTAAVHVVPGIYLLCFVIWLRRGRGMNRNLPAAAVFCSSFFTIFPADAYRAYTCHAASGLARIGAGSLGDSLLLTPAILAGMHTLVYFFCELDERGRVPIRDYLRRQFSVVT
ncbi:hypothetical protein [Burkholderia ubonensis]|uniref:hypothetical protein n=1 Tax=Burkholderia ubonensis TaxID=101571 RepID=UPI00075677A9|nr:hypothetical protein [Burkholderia ubonensis]KWK68785.1 hypothetical protein WM15_06205 [Burkholderia ubonensis]